MSKISINIDYKTLMKLIGDNTEAHVEIQNSIVANFAKSKLKTLLNSESMQKRISDAEEIILTAIKIEAEKNMGRWSRDGWQKSFELNKDVKDYISAFMHRENEALISEFSTKTRDYIRKSISEWGEYYENKIDESLDEKINTEFEARVQEEVIKRINSLKS